MKYMKNVIHNHVYKTNYFFGNPFQCHPWVVWGYNAFGVRGKIYYCGHAYSSLILRCYLLLIYQIYDLQMRRILSQSYKSINKNDLQSPSNENDPSNHGELKHPTAPECNRSWLTSSQTRAVPVSRHFTFGPAVVDRRLEKVRRRERRCLYDLQPNSYFHWNV